MIWQIVLWILKLIGWLLLAVVVILLLSLCLILFVPFRYEGKGGCEGTKETLWGRLRFSWFFSFDRRMDRICGRKIKVAFSNRMEDAGSEVRRTGHGNGGKSSRRNTSKNTGRNRRSNEKKRKRTGKEIGREICREIDRSTERRTEKTCLKRQKEPEKKRFFERIEYTFQTFCDKMNVLTEKKETIFAFLEDEIHHAAFFKAIQTLKRLLKRLRPRRFTGKVRFGFEDPSVTGKVLAVISMIAPFWEGSIDVEPEFDEKILTGELEIAGSIAVWKFAAFALSVLMDKNIRKTIVHIRNFKF